LSVTLTWGEGKEILCDSVGANVEFFEYYE